MLCIFLVVPLVCVWSVVVTFPGHARLLFFCPLQGSAYVVIFPIICCCSNCVCVGGGWKFCPVLLYILCVLSSPAMKRKLLALF